MKRFLFVLVGSFVAASFASAQTSTSWGSAAWVWDQADANHVAQSNDPRFLRLSFTLSAKATRAELWVTVDNHYTAFVNGQKAGSDGEWSTIEKYDVVKHLVQGKNVVALEARNHGGVAGAIARLHVQTADGKDVIVATNEKTRITQTAAKDWLLPDFDDSAWPAAFVLGDPGIGPWHLQGARPAAKGGGSGYDVGAVDSNVKSRLSPEEQLKHFNFPKDFTVELVVADPLVINPVTMTVDDKGRMYVSESHTYRYGPSGSPVKPYANPVVRLEPIPGGKGYTRTLVADGFDDPVMGIAIKGDKIWLAANNYLYLCDLTPEGKAINKKTLLVDKNKAWNPFGMFVLEWGPDGLLYMSVGNHGINIEGPDGNITSRGGSGIIMRMQPDGTKMERLVHGLRVPYSFEYDPFGQLWLLSNGEGNPNRFVRVIEGVDYHCYSRGAVDNNWLAGNHPLAPPCFELPRGAHTQLMRYYAAGFPAPYQGNLFLCNWGAHGFAGPNRAIFRFVPDEHGKITTKESLLSCTDPHFRPSHIALDPDGNLLVSDWYGRDDESDMTGRIWRLRYTGSDKPMVWHDLAADKWSDDDYVISALGSPHHLIREKAAQTLVDRLKVGKNLTLLMPSGQSSRGRETPALAAAEALWVLHRANTPMAIDAISAGCSHADPAVRRLAADLLRREHRLDDIRKTLLKRGEDDASVLVRTALAFPSDKIVGGLVSALHNGAAANEHVRYEAAWHLAKHADEKSFAKLLTADDEQIRLAGMIAIDVACYENFDSKPAALAALARALENPGKADLDLLLTLAQLDGDSSLTPALTKLLARQDLPAAATARTIMILRSRGGLAKNVDAAVGKRLIEAVAKGTVRASTPAEQITILEFLDAEGPTDFALKHVAGQLRAKQPEVREAAHVVARKFGAKGSPLAGQLWNAVLDSKTKSDEAVELLSTLARIEARPDSSRWQKLLAQDEPLLRTEAVRWWRSFKGKDLAGVLQQQAPELIKADANLRDDIAAVVRELDNQPPASTDKASLGQQTLSALNAMSAADKAKRATLGRQVFERAACTKCHTTATQTTPLAPSLKGIAAQKIDYLIESVLYPSKIIKTGFETETITTKDGRVLSGLVKEEGGFLRVLNLDKDNRVAKSDIEERAVQRVSIMPEGQESQLSRREFEDLIAYLMTLR